MKNYIFSWLLSKHSVSKLQWPFVYWFFISRPFVKMSRTPWHEKTESRSSSYLYHTQSFNPVRHEHHHFITGFREHARKTTIVLFGSVSMSQSVLAYQMTTWYGHKSAAEAERLIVEHWSHFTFFYNNTLAAYIRLLRSKASLATEYIHFTHTASVKAGGTQ